MALHCCLVAVVNKPTRQAPIPNVNWEPKHQGCFPPHGSRFHLSTGPKPGRTKRHRTPSSTPSARCACPFTDIQWQVSSGNDTARPNSRKLVSYPCLAGNACLPIGTYSACSACTWTILKWLAPHTTSRRHGTPFASPAFKLTIPNRLRIILVVINTKPRLPGNRQKQGYKTYPTCCHDQGNSTRH